MATNASLKETIEESTRSSPGREAIRIIRRKFFSSQGGANFSSSTEQRALFEHHMAPLPQPVGTALESRSPAIDRYASVARHPGNDKPLDTQRDLQDLLSPNSDTGVQAPSHAAERAFSSVNRYESAPREHLVAGARSDCAATSEPRPPPMTSDRSANTSRALSVAELAAGENHLDDLSSMANARRDALSPFESLDRVSLRLRPILKHSTHPNGTPASARELPPGFTWVMMPVPVDVTDSSQTLAALKSQVAALCMQQSPSQQPSPRSPLLKRDVAFSDEEVPVILRGAGEADSYRSELQRSSILLEAGAREQSGASSPVFSYLSSSIGAQDLNSDTASRRMVRFENERCAAQARDTCPSENTLVSYATFVHTEPESSGLVASLNADTRYNRSDALQSQGPKGSGAKAAEKLLPATVASGHSVAKGSGSPFAKLWRSLRRLPGPRKRDTDAGASSGENQCASPQRPRSTIKKGFWRSLQRGLFRSRSRRQDGTPPERAANRAADNHVASQSFYGSAADRSHESSLRSENGKNRSEPRASLSMGCLAIAPRSNEDTSFDADVLSCGSAEYMATSATELDAPRPKHRQSHGFAGGAIFPLSSKQSISDTCSQPVDSWRRWSVARAPLECEPPDCTLPSVAVREELAEATVQQAPAENSPLVVLKRKVTQCDITAPDTFLIASTKPALSPRLLARGAQPLFERSSTVPGISNLSAGGTPLETEEQRASRDPNNSRSPAPSRGPNITQLKPSPAPEKKLPHRKLSFTTLFAKAPLFGKQRSRSVAVFVPPVDSDACRSEGSSTLDMSEGSQTSTLNVNFGDTLEQCAPDIYLQLETPGCRSTLLLEPEPVASLPPVFEEPPPVFQPPMRVSPITTLFTPIAKEADSLTGHPYNTLDLNRPVKFGDQEQLQDVFPIQSPSMESVWHERRLEEGPTYEYLAPRPIAMPLGVAPGDSKRPLESPSNCSASSSPYVYRFPSSSVSSASDGIESDQKRQPESHESNFSSNKRAQLEAELTISTAQQLRDRLESAATSQTRLPPPPPIAAIATATGGHSGATRTRRGFLARLFSRKPSKKLLTLKAAQERANKAALEKPLIDSKPKQSPMGGHLWLSAAPSEQRSAVEEPHGLRSPTRREQIAKQTNNTLDEPFELVRAQRFAPNCQQVAVAPAPPGLLSPGTARAKFSPRILADQLWGLASPDVRQARRERGWIVDIINAPTVCIDRCGHSIRLNTPHCTHSTETEVERGEKRLRGMCSFVRRSRWKSHSSSTERLTEKLSVNSTNRQSHRRHTHHHIHQHSMSPLVERAHKKTVSLDHSATAPRFHLPKSSNAIPEVE